MALKGYFLDNETYSAIDVNNAFSYLTTKGVSLFSDTGSVITDINAALAALTSGGVDIYNINSCMVYKVGEVYKVKKGICFLHDGAFLVIDDDEYTLAITKGVLNYVYALHDPLKNTCGVYVSTESVPQNAISLAEIDAEGNVIDKRVFSQAKVAVPTTNITASKELTLYYPTGINNGYTYHEEAFDVGFGGFNYVRAEFDEKTYFVYIGDNKQRQFVDSSGGSSWIRKEGNSLIIKTGTWGKYGSRNRDVEIFLF